MNHSWRLSLGLRENNVDEVFRRRHGLNALEIIEWHYDDGNNMQDERKVLNEEIRK